jgi:hypothetical protein
MRNVILGAKRSERGHSSRRTTQPQSSRGDFIFMPTRADEQIELFTYALYIIFKLLAGSFWSLPTQKGLIKYALSC